MNPAFGARLRAALDAKGPLCVGVDPHASLLDAWGLAQSADGAREFGLRVVDAAAGLVGVVKPQVAFFERFGSRGFAALEDVVAAAGAAGLLVIADAKRGDIGSTNEGYADAWLTPGSPLEADAVTLSPYLGADALDVLFARAYQHRKGAFVLAATSNQEAAALQMATAASGLSVAASVATAVAALDGGSDGLASIGTVIGAGTDRSEFGLTDTMLAGLPILAPGFGTQGATPAELPTRFGALSRNVLASESRSILQAGPDRVASRIEQTALRYQEVLSV